MPETLDQRTLCVAFDFDGTLADTSSAIVQTAQQTLRELRLPVAEKSQILPLIGLPLTEIFLGLGVPPGSADACAQRYRELFFGHALEVELFPAVRACLDDLQKRGLKMAVVSSRSRTSLLDLLARLKIEHYFCEILGAEDAEQKKPAPDLLLALAARLALAPASFLVVGDTTYDIEMGRRAGARTCAVTYGNHDKELLEAAQPHQQVGSLSELGALIRA